MNKDSSANQVKYSVEILFTDRAYRARKIHASTFNDLLDQAFSQEGFKAPYRLSVSSENSTSFNRLDHLGKA